MALHTGLSGVVGTLQAVMNFIVKIFTAIGGYLHQRHVKLVQLVANYPGYIAVILELLIIFGLLTLIWKVFHIGNSKLGKKLKDLTKTKNFWIPAAVILFVFIIIFVI